MWTDDLGIALLAEGVETGREQAAVARSGCDYAQGYYLAKPAPQLPPVSRPVPCIAPPAPAAAHPSPALAFYAQAVADSTIPSYVVDRGRVLVAWNGAAERLLGDPAGQVVWQRCAGSPLDHRDGAGRLLCRGFCPLLHSMAEQESDPPATRSLRGTGPVQRGRLLPPRPRLLSLVVPRQSPGDPSGAPTAAGILAPRGPKGPSGPGVDGALSYEDVDRLAGGDLRHDEVGLAANPSPV